jgi:hypothetical protein
MASLIPFSVCVCSRAVHNRWVCLHTKSFFLQRCLLLLPRRDRGDLFVLLVGSIDLTAAQTNIYTHDLVFTNLAQWVPKHTFTRKVQTSKHYSCAYKIVLVVLSHGHHSTSYYYIWWIYTRFVSNYLSLSTFDHNIWLFILFKKLCIHHLFVCDLLYHQSYFKYKLNILHICTIFWIE